MTKKHTVQLEEREAKPGSFVDITGFVNEYGIRFIRFAGFKKQYAAWECECPLCGEHFVVRGSCRKTVQSCGCKNAKRPDAARRNWMRKIWLKFIVGQCVPEWEDFETFYSDMPDSMQQGCLIYRLNTADKFSKLNYNIVETDRRSTHRCKTLQVGSKLMTSTQIGDLLGLSRQRVHQLMKNQEDLRQRVEDELLTPSHRCP